MQFNNLATLFIIGFIIFLAIDDLRLYFKCEKLNSYIRELERQLREK